MANKPTYQELEQEIRRLEKEVHDRKDVETALKDYIAYQSLLSVLRGVGPERTEAVLLQTFLSEVVKQYGFCMSWYGRYLDGKIRPVLSAGRVDRYLDNLVLEIKEPTSPDAQCAMSKAILEAAPFTYTDLEKDEGFRQWRDYAIELGYRSNLALPLEVEGQVEGGIMVYADAPKAFPEERIQRLQLLTSELGIILRGRRVRERLDEALRKSEQMYRTLVETSHDVMFIVDLKGNFLFTNKAFETILGYSDKDREKINGFDLVHPEDLDHVRKRFRGLIGGRRENNMEYRYRARDGSYIHILTSASPVFDSQGKVVSAFGIARDVTELKVAEEALRKAHDELEQRVEERTIELTRINEQLKLEIRERKRAEEALQIKDRAIASSINGIAFAEFGGNLTYVNKSFVAMWGYSSYDEVLGRPAVEFWQIPDDALKVVGKLGISGSWIGELVAKRKDGSLFDTQISASIISNKTGEPIHMMASFVDITERKRAAEALKQSERRFRQLTESIREVFWMSDLDKTEMLYVSPAYEEIWGRTCESLYEHPRSFVDAVHPEDREDVISSFDAQRRGDRIAVEYRIIQPNGSERVIWSRGFPIRNEHGEISCIAGIAEDITERKQMEDALRKSNKELKAQTHKLEEMNSALSVLLERRGKDREELEKKLVSNVKELILPYIETLKKTPLNAKQMTCVSVLESNLKEIVSPFLRKLASEYFGLTPKEIQIAGLVKQGKTTKEIAEFFDVSTRAVQFHRNNIRAKLGLKNQRINLGTYLLSFS